MLGLGSFEAMSSAHVIGFFSIANLDFKLYIPYRFTLNTIANLGSAARPAVEANV